MTGALTVRQALAAAVAQLKAAGIEQPALDARLLMAAALGTGPERVTMLISDPLPDPLAFQAMIDRRAAHEPVSKITGRRSFYGRDFAVTRDVLDPRPDTELLIDLALAERPARLLDLGTGSGCILLTLLAELPEASGVATDISAPALAVAAKNAAALGVASRVTLLEGSWFAPVSGRFDLIVSNPPYIASAEMPDLAPDVRLYDPEGALTDYADGLSAYRLIAAGAPDFLEPGGRLILEIGWQQGADVAALLVAAGFAEVAVHPDLEGRDRAVTGRMPAVAGHS